jgi:hypothetical protein
MKTARAAAVLTWVYAACFGIPAIPVASYLLTNGYLPTFFGLFAMYGGPWSSRLEAGTFVALLVAFLLVIVVAAWSAWWVWEGRKVGMLINLAILPVEAVFWLGFALPFPWLIGIARAGLLGIAWRSLDDPQSSRPEQTAGTTGQAHRPDLR